MKRVYFFLLPVTISLLFVMCDKNPVNNNNTTGHIGAWVPSVIYQKQWDENGVVAMDTTMTWDEYMTYLMLMDYEMVMEIIEDKFIGHMYVDSEYTVDTMRYYLEGDNLKGEILNTMDSIFILNYYKLNVENNQLVLSSDYSVKDEYIQMVGFSKQVARVSYSKYTGKIPPDHWITVLRRNSKVFFCLLFGFK